VDSRFDLAVPEIGLPEQVVEGAKPASSARPDGHYWLRAEINGHPASFLVDTGATLTAISDETAAAPGSSRARPGCRCGCRPPTARSPPS
jgi:aspartyl protease family protein